MYFPAYNFLLYILSFDTLLSVHRCPYHNQGFTSSQKFVMTDIFLYQHKNQLIFRSSTSTCKICTIRLLNGGKCGRRKTVCVCVEGDHDLGGKGGQQWPFKNIWLFWRVKTTTVCLKITSCSFFSVTCVSLWSSKVCSGDYSQIFLLFACFLLFLLFLILNILKWSRPLSKKLGLRL